MKNIKIGVFGAGTRGMWLSRAFMMLGCEIVALCDTRDAEMQRTAKEVGGDVAIYHDFDAFIEHEMDAVLLCYNFHEHAPYAIRCFEKNLHVFSECISNGTMAEGVELVEAFEKSRSIYMLAENYPQMIFNREIKRVCDGGTLGKLLYAEGEYNHPGDPNDIEFKRDYNYFEKHWRNFLPATYYITHSLGPVMAATGATPTQVSALCSYAPIEGDVPTASYAGDRAAIITTQNDDGSIFRVTGCARFGGHHNAYRVCGTKGQIENLRGMDSQIMLRYNAWEKPKGMEEVNLYTPSWNDPDEDLIIKSGHGGADYLTARIFVESIREGKQPPHPFDIYSATVMSSVAILGNRSMLEGGVPYRIPDFRRASDRAQYAHDRATPFWQGEKAPDVPCCSHTDFAPTEKQKELYREVLGIK